MGGSIARKVTLSTALNLAQQMVLVLGSVFVARRVGPEVMGIVAYAGAYVGVFQSLSDFGFGTAHIKRVSEGQNLGQCMGMAWLAKLAGLIAMSLAVLTSFWVGGYKSFHGQTGEIVFYVSLITLVVSQLTLVPNSTLIAFQNVIQKDVPATITQLTSAILRVCLAILGLGAIGLAAADSVGIILLLLVYLALLRTLPLEWPSKTIFKSYLTFGLPMFVVTVVTSVGQGLDRVLLQLIDGAIDVGQYSAGMRFGSVLSFLSNAVAGLIFPSMSRSYSEGRPEEAFALCGRAERQLALVLFPFLLGVTPIARPAALLLLGEKYADTGPVIVLGTVAMIFQTLTQPYRQMMYGSEKMKFSVLAEVALLAVQTSLLYLFLSHSLGPSFPFQGAPAAAAGMALASLVGATAWRGLTVRTLKARLDKRVWIHAASAVALFLPAYVVSFGPSPLPYAAAVVLAVAAASVHLSVLRATGELGPEQIRVISNLVASFGLGLRPIKSSVGETP
jgi:O-antigen/teichoic acid export membrane protein